MRWVFVIGLSAVIAVSAVWGQAPSLSLGSSGFRQSDAAPRPAATSVGGTGFGYQLARKATLGMLAGLNSEVLFGNAPPAGGALSALMLYVPSMILVDELIQYWDLDALSTVALGALYGIWLEGLVTNMIPESPLWFLTGITTFWHGVMTTYAASEVTEAWLPRRSPGTLQTGWVIAGAVSLAAWPFLFQPKGAPLQLSDWPSYAATAAVALGAGALLAHRIRIERTYRPTPLVATGTIAVGFAVGLGVIALTTVAEGQSPYTAQDHIVRGGIYLAIEGATLVKLFAGKRANDGG
ncbi:MAG: hypothetical protein ACOC2N_02015 [Spirochaetota bacterium]